MDIGEVLNGVFDDDIGWRPASGSIKPVHVANGLARAVQGRYYDVRLLGHFVVSWKAGKVPDERRAFDALVKGEPRARFGALADAQQEFEKTRRYALGLLGTDRALFPTIEQSAFSLTCGRMVTRTGNDRRLGEFAAFLLGEEGEETASLATEVRRCLQADRPQDPLTALVWPLLPADDQAHESQRDYRFVRVGKQKHNRAVFTELREAARCLATHEAAQGNRLRTLQRAVHFTCIATHAHAQALAANGILADRPPALVAIAGHRRSDVAIASERSLDGLYSQLERWLGERLARRISEKSPINSGKSDGERLEIETTDGRSVRALLARIDTADRTPRTPSKEELDVRVQSFMAARREFGDEDPARVLGHALVECYVREYESGGPRGFLQALGRKTGLLYPHFQGRAREKRVRPSVPVLDVLVRACVPSGEAIELDLFLDRLWARFGLIVGGRRSEAWDDVDYLERKGLSVNVDELARNAEAFVDELVMMGLARRYPDGVTFVGDGYAG